MITQEAPGGRQYDRFILHLRRRISRANERSAMSLSRPELRIVGDTVTRLSEFLDYVEALERRLELALTPEEAPIPLPLAAQEPSPLGRPLSETVELIRGHLAHSPNDAERPPTTEGPR